jgi:hypothetical protein
MIQVDVSTLKPFFKAVEDLDDNGVVSEGDRIRTNEDVYTVTDSQVQNLSKFATFLTNVNGQGRQFRLLTDADGNYASHVDYYLAYSKAGAANEIEGLVHLGESVETYDTDDSYTSYNDATDSLADLAQTYSTKVFAGTDNPALVKKYVRLVAEYDLVMADLRCNWTGDTVQSSLVRKEELERKLERLANRMDG